MKDEIKEIKISKSNHSIVIIKNGVTVKEQFAIDDEILDYITNLQESEAYYYGQYKDYKSRNEKAILGLQNIKVACHFAGYKKIEKMIEKEQFFLAGEDEVVDMLENGGDDNE